MSAGEGLKVGWGNPTPYTARGKFHYFGDDGRSLCGKWAKFLTEIDSDALDEHPDNCSTCKKRVAKYRAERAKAQA